MEKPSSDLQDRMKTLIRCVMCKGEFSELKMLTCQHLACLPCLHDVISLTDDKFSCAVCSQEIMVPNGGAEGFSESLMTKQVASMLGVNAKPPDRTEVSSSDTSVSSVEQNKDSNESERNEKAINAQVAAVMKNRTKRGALRKELEKKAAEAVEWTQLSEKNQEYIKGKTAKLPEEVNELEKAIIKMREKKTKAIQDQIDELNKAALSKMMSLESTRRDRQEEYETFKRETEPKLYEVRDTLKDTEDIIRDLAANKKCTKTTVGKALNKLDKLNSIDFARGVEFKAFRRGDSVRLEIDQEKLESVADLLKDVDYDGIGRILDVEHSNEKPLRVMFPGQTEAKNYSADSLIKSLVPSSMPWLYDTVIIAEKPREENFRHSEDYDQAMKWFKHKTEGIIFQQQYRTETHENISTFVAFPGGLIWKGKDSQLKISHMRLKAGIEVILRPGLKEPSRGFSGVTRSSIGILKRGFVWPDDDVKVDFPECHSWHGNWTEVVPFRLAMEGDYVQPKLTVDVTQSKWKGVKHEDVGKVRQVYYDDIYEANNPQYVLVQFGSKRVESLPHDFDLAQPPTEAEEEEEVELAFNPFRFMLAQQLFRQQLQFYDHDDDDDHELDFYW